MASIPGTGVVLTVFPSARERSSVAIPQLFTKIFNELSIYLQSGVLQIANQILVACGQLSGCITKNLTLCLSGDISPVVTQEARDYFGERLPQRTKSV